jgi:hypothetical protein
MGKTNASKSQKEETIAEQSEEEQVDHETQDDSTPLYSDVVANGSGTISGTISNGSGTTLLDSTLSGKRTSNEDGEKESKKQRRARLSQSTLQEVMEKSAATEKLSSVAKIKNLTLRIDQVYSDNVAFQKELTLLQNQSQDQPVKSDSTNYGYFENTTIEAK